MGFSDDDIAMLLRGNHASFTCQRALLVAVNYCLQSNTQVKRRMTVLFLRGGSNSNARVLQALGEVAMKLLATGIKENALVARLGRYAADPSNRLTCAINLLGSLYCNSVPLNALDIGQHTSTVLDNDS
jgi:hypothetical protein